MLAQFAKKSKKSEGPTATEDADMGDGDEAQTGEDKLLFTEIMSKLLG